VRFLEPSMIPSLKSIILMGEAMSQGNLDTWSKINLINGYVTLTCVRHVNLLDFAVMARASVRSRQLSAVR
jgi:hypothetical protein